MIHRSIQFGKASEEIHPAASKGSLVTARKRLNNTAPATIIKTRHEMRSVSTIDALKFFHDSFLLTRHKTSPMAQLAAAASVAVTTPVKRAYIMTIKRIKISRRSGMAFSLSVQVLFGPLGPQSG
jgi:pyruvate carboxylase